MSRDTSLLWSTSCFAVLCMVSAPAPGVAAPLGGAVVRSGSLAASRTTEVQVAGTRVQLEAVADQVFTETRARAAELGRARRYLMADPVVTEEFTETASSVVMTSRTAFTVVDPEGLRRASPRFRRHGAGSQDRQGLSLARLNPTQRQRFDAFKAEVNTRPAGHPLRVAAQQGDEALLEAVTGGKGDVSITTEVTFPKARVPIVAGKAMVPLATDEGLDRSRVGSRSFPLVASVAAPASGPAVSASRVAQASRVDTSEEGTGTAVRTREFLTGWGEYQSYDWSERWDLGKHDYFKVGFHAGYAFGLRAPLEVTGTLTPTNFRRTQDPDVASDYEVELQAETFDGSEADYKDLGLSNQEAADGHELVLEADAYAKIDVEAGWGVISIHQKIPSNLGIDWGKDFKPPFGGASSAFEFWVPASVTRTSISLLGIVSGSAQLGVKVGGTGSASIDYLSLLDTAGVSSTSGGRAAQTRTLTFPGPASKTKVKTTLPAVTESGTRKYGYRLSRPKYSWNVTVTPGVKGTVEVNAKPFFSEDVVIGPFWFGVAAVHLGTLGLSAHAGTTSSYDVLPGRKTYLPPLKASVASKAGAAVATKKSSSAARESLQVPKLTPRTSRRDMVPRR